MQSGDQVGTDVDDQDVEIQAQTSLARDLDPQFHYL